MYSVFFSKIDIGYLYCIDRLKEIIKPNSKVVIIIESPIAIVLYLFRITFQFSATPHEYPH